MSTREKPIIPGTPEFLALPPEEQQARVARVLDRASQVDRLYVDLPADVYGEWIKDEPLALAEAERKGFVIDEVYAPKHTIHESNRQGDVVFMTMPKALKELYDKQERANYTQTHGKKDPKTGVVKNQAEDIEFKNSPIGLPTIDESSSTEISGTEISTTLGGS